MMTTVDYAVLSLVYEYLTTLNKKAVTYDSLIAFAKKHKKTVYRDETITRTLRRLAEHGYFDRKYVNSYNNPRAKIVIYMPTENFWKFFENKKSVRA